MTPPLSLYPYQVEGAEAFIRHPAFWIADEMGLGKTAQAIRAAECTPWQRNLVVCPALVRGVWVQEIAKWSCLEPFVKELRSGAQATFLEVKGPGWWIVSYAYARKYWRRFVGRVDRIIFDEVHALKNLEAKQTQELLGKGGFAQQPGIRSIWALTGTPSPNHPGELYPLLATLGGLPADVRGYGSFCKQYCICDSEGNPLELRAGEPALRLKESISRVMLRRTKAEVGLQLPPITRSTVWVDGRDPTLQELAGSALARFSPEELRKAVEEQRLAGMEALELAKGDILTAGISTLRVWIALRKRAAILSLLEEEHQAKLYDRLIVFGIHRDMLQWLVAHLPKTMAPALIDGQTPARDREIIINDWRMGRVRTLLGQIHAMGTGVTLTEASHVLNLEPWWNEDINDQALARLHRIGQVNPVNLRYVMLDEEPFEHALLRTLERKKNYNQALWT